MKNTPENRAAVNALIETARIRDTGYQIKVWDYDDDISLSVRQPRDTENIAYPEIFCKDDWYGDKALGFEICTTGYGDHSIAQARRAVAGLETALGLVEALLTTAELYGLRIHR